MKLNKAALGSSGILAVLALSACGLQTAPATSATQTPTPSDSYIKQTLRSCGVVSSKYATLGDKDRTVTLQGQPKSSTRGMTMKEIGCVLTGVDTPDSVISRMDGTRALDGMQNASWKGYEASWTFHPDNGVRIILTESK
ncbi:conserved exported hypothetical protein [Arthrobacter sp. 8AJ]|nr:conserved exported hypothetical protein [Arthrobacter sp. 8AJ]